MKIIHVRTESLGDSTYLLTHENTGIVVDPQRDVDRFEHLIAESGIEPRLVLETHLHNDYISGGPELARKTGAELVLPAAAAPAYRHRPAFHLEDIELGDLVVRPIHTPGHTPEHTSYLVLVEDLPVAVFSGGSLLVGSAGRPDLMGPERADTLARLQFTSINRLAALPDEVGLYPTHGQGSFCSISIATGPTSTIGAERKGNPALAFSDEDSFVEGQLAGLGPFPAYYSQMGPANVFGAPPLSIREVPVLTREDFEEMIPSAIVVDARPREHFAEGHLLGSLAIELGDSFGTWVGWVLPYQAPLILVLEPEQDLEEAMRQLGRIGFEDVRGVIRDLNHWDVDLESHRVVGIEEFTSAVVDGEQVLDVRSPIDWVEGTIPGSTLAYVPDVARATPVGLDQGREVWVVCESGYRANLAAAILEVRGFRPVVLVGYGVPEVLNSLSS
ncbi:MAG: MBL fold metallo-hydrolase [Actinomycetota bacterium]|nr:MBL fold metallo-hydrolase [Actinomycetota bacterium]